jgi:hypothetical protein
MGEGWPVCQTGLKLCVELNLQTHPVWVLARDGVRAGTENVQPNTVSRRQFSAQIVVDGAFIGRNAPNKCNKPANSVG